MSRIYTLSAENVTLGTGNVLGAIRTAADLATAAGKLLLRRLEIFQNGSTTLAMIRGAISKRDTAGTLTMTSTTPRAISPMDGPASGISGNTAPAGGAAQSGTNSSADSGGTYTDLMPFNFANLNGYLWVPTPEDRIIVPPASVITVRLLTAPGTTSGWGFCLTFEELV